MDMGSTGRINQKRPGPPGHNKGEGKMTTTEIIEKAINLAKEEQANYSAIPLSRLDNPYQKIAGCLPCGYDELFPEQNEVGKNSFDFAEKIADQVDTIWSNM